MLTKTAMMFRKGMNPGFPVLCSAVSHHASSTVLQNKGRVGGGNSMQVFSYYFYIQTKSVCHKIRNSCFSLHMNFDICQMVFSYLLCFINIICWIITMIYYHGNMCNIYIYMYIFITDRVVGGETMFSGDNMTDFYWWKM